MGIFAQFRPTNKKQQASYKYHTSNEDNDEDRDDEDRVVQALIQCILSQANAGLNVKSAYFKY